MTPRPEAEVRKAMRLLACRILQAIDCPCDNCRRASIGSEQTLKTLAWAFGVPVGYALLPNPRSLGDQEEVASYVSDPRLAEILPPGKDGAA